MSTIVTRAGKGSALTWTEADANFTNLNTDKYQSGDSPSFADLTVTSGTIVSGNVPWQGYRSGAGGTYIMGMGATPVQWASTGEYYGYQLGTKAFWVTYQGGSTTTFSHGMRLSSATNYVYTTTGLTPIWVEYSGGQALFAGAASGTAGDTIVPNYPLQIDAGVNVVNLLCGQLAFPSTQNPSADPNALDDYEEGDWTPTITFGGGATGLTYTSQNGKYTKVGRQVTILGQVTVNAKGSSTGVISINGLPFTTYNGQARGGVGVGYYGGAVLTSGGITILARTNATGCDLFQEGTGSTSQMTEGHISAGFDLYFNFSYITA